MVEKTIEELLELLNKNEISSYDLVKESLDKAHNLQEKYNSFVTICDDNLELAKEDNSKKLLKGIPCAIKDNISTKGILTTASSNILKDYVPFFDATSVINLKNNGAINIGKTVLDELAMGGSGTTGHTGVVKNPWDSSRLIGGSSAGSAAVVASGIVPFSLGSDTGDSIRKPACYGGIVGYKPTYGLVSRFGLFPFACSLDHVGCFTRSVKDAALVIDAIKGKDEKDMTSIDSSNMEIYKSIDINNIKGKKLFYIDEIVNKDTYKDCMDKELEDILNNFNSLVETYKQLGASVTPVSIDIKLLEAIFPTYFAISCAEATSNNSNLTGIIFGPRGEGESIEEIMFDARSKGFSELIKRRFVLGSFILQRENQEKLFLNAQRIRRILVEKLTSLFKEYDGLILPASGSIAPSFEQSSEEVNSKLSTRYLLLENHMALGNFGGFPSITIPCGIVNNMPIGLSITSGVAKDIDCLNIAYALESKLPYKGQIAKEVK